MEPSQSYANVEALLNIVANGQEILGICAGGSALALGWIPMALGAKGYTSKMYLLSVATFVLALGAPFVVNMFTSGSRGANGEMLLMAGVILTFLSALVTIALYLSIALFPTFMAVRENLANKGLVIGLNVGGFLLPLLWLVALIIASLAITKKQVGPVVQMIKDRHSESNE